MMQKWLLFIKERFNPASHLTMIFLFVFSIYFLNPFQSDLLTHTIKLFSILIFTICLFFKLRLFDEIKDYELDCLINPTRPLVRGLVSKVDLYKIIGLCTFIEFLSIISLEIINSESHLYLGILVIGYSFLMFKEFFIPTLIRPHLTTYAIMHTFVCFLLSYFLLSSSQNISIYPLKEDSLQLALATWFLFNIFEIGRKTFASNEEREQVESYSKIWGRAGASGLVLFQGWAVMTLLQKYIELSAVKMFFLLFYTVFIIAASLYVIKDKVLFAKIYRALSSFFIIVTFSLLLIDRGFKL